MRNSSQVSNALRLSFCVIGLICATGCGSSQKKSDSSSSVISNSASENEISSVDVDTSEADVPSLKSASDNSKASNLDPRYRSLGQAIRSGRSKSITDEAAKLLGTNAYDPVALNALALLHLKRGHPGAAKLLLNKAIDRNPGTASLYNNLGVSMSQEGDDAAALTNFKKALKADGSHRETLGNLGSMYMKGGDVSRALPLLEQSYKANRGNLSVANNYAIALRLSGDLEGASRIYDEILKADPKNLNALVNDAILLIEFMNKPKDGLTLVYKIKFMETDRKDVVARANALEKKAKAALQ